MALVANISKQQHSSDARSSSEIPSDSSSASNGWALTESADKMDGTPVIVLRKSGSEGSTMVIRCAKHKTDAYIDTGTILDDGNVRIRFDDSPPLRQAWGKSTDDKSLFAPDAITFARQLTKTQTVLMEFTPFREGTKTLSFDVSKLDDKLKKISDACNWEAVDQRRAQGKMIDAKLRARLMPYVHRCERQDLGTWCWSDPDGALNDDNGFNPTKEGALADAIENARSGIAFRDTSQTDAEGNEAPQ